MHFLLVNTQEAHEDYLSENQAIYGVTHETNEDMRSVSFVVLCVNVNEL